MKIFRLFSLIIALLMVLTMFAACDSTEATPTTNDDVDADITSVIVNDDGKTINADKDEFTVDVSNSGELKEGAEPISSNKFELAGTTYTFPIKMSELFNNGWSLSKGFKYQTEFDANSKTNLVSYYLVHESGAEIMLEQMTNDSSEKKDIKDCTLTAFGINSYSSSDFKFVLPGGIIPTSTAANVLDVFGDPNTTTEFAGYSYNLEEQLTYEKHISSNISYSFAFNEDGSFYSIGIDYES